MTAPPEKTEETPAQIDIKVIIGGRQTEGIKLSLLGKTDLAGLIELLTWTKERIVPNDEQYEVIESYPPGP